MVLYILALQVIYPGVFMSIKITLLKGFAAKYNVNLLVYYEEFQTPIDAIRREKQLKKWNRLLKIELIERVNPQWKDLYIEELSKEDSL